MRRTFLGLLLALACVPSAQAFIDPLVLIPAQPVERQAFSFTIRHGNCDSIFIPTDGGADDRFRQIEVVGNVVRVTVVYNSTLPPGCTHPTVTSQIWLNPLAAGNYQLELIGRPAGQSNRPNVLLQTVPLQVLPLPVVVPSVSALGALTMMALVAVAALSRLRDAS